MYPYRLCYASPYQINDDLHLTSKGSFSSNIKWLTSMNLWQSIQCGPVMSNCYKIKLSKISWPNLKIRTQVTYGYQYWSLSILVCFCFCFFKICLLERECKCTLEWWGETEGETLKQTPLWAQEAMQSQSHHPEIMSRAKIKSQILTWATKMPQSLPILNP